MTLSNFTMSVVATQRAARCRMAGLPVVIAIEAAPLPVGQGQPSARTGVPLAYPHGRSAPVDLVLEVLERVLRFLDD